MLFERFHIDLPLLLGILALMAFGLIVMYSASGQSLAMMDRQAMRMVLSLTVMIILAQISPRTYETLAPAMFFAGVLLLLGVLFFGEASKGAQRWLNLGFVRFQPSELLKLAVPLMVARYIGKRLLDDLQQRTGSRPTRIQVGVDESNGQWGFCELQDE